MYNMSAITKCADNNYSTGSPAARRLLSAEKAVSVIAFFFFFFPLRQAPNRSNIRLTSASPRNVFESSPRPPPTVDGPPPPSRRDAPGCRLPPSLPPLTLAARPPPPERVSSGSGRVALRGRSETAADAPERKGIAACAVHCQHGRVSARCLVRARDGITRAGAHRRDAPGATFETMRRTF